jgi:hypothetical protein
MCVNVSGFWGMLTMKGLIIIVHVQYALSKLLHHNETGLGGSIITSHELFTIQITSLFENNQVYKYAQQKIISSVTMASC